jgi:hypothetical protein
MKITPWSYLKDEPEPDAPISDNPSGLYCPACRAIGHSHCAWPEYCGSMERMKEKVVIRWRRVKNDTWCS